MLRRSFFGAVVAIGTAGLILLPTVASRVASADNGRVSVRVTNGTTLTGKQLQGKRTTSTRTSSASASAGSGGLVTSTAVAGIVYVDGQPLCAFGIGRTQAVKLDFTPDVIEEGTLVINASEAGTTFTEGFGDTSAETACIPVTRFDIVTMRVFSSAKWPLLGGRTLYQSVSSSATNVA